MKYNFSCAAFFGLAFLLQSCKFSCSVGDSDKEPTGSAVEQDGARIYNNIKLQTYKAKLRKAWLVFEDGTRVPDDNFVDFTQPVRMMLAIDSGWTEQNERVKLGASEKIIAENGTVLLEKEDLFESYPDGISIKDSKLIYLTASLKVRKDISPTSFSVQFRIWDKAGDGYIEGSYMLFSK